MGNHDSMSAAASKPDGDRHAALHEVVDDLVRRGKNAEKTAETTVFVNGGCMVPVLENGAEVRLRAAAIYWPGDIVAFRDRAGRLRVHRLIGYRFVEGKLACVTRGDRAATHDPPVLENRILGRVVHPTSAMPNVGARLRTVVTFAKIVFRSMTIARRGDPVLA